MTLHVFVGYDVREHPAWLVCRDSLINPLDGPRGLDVQVHPLVHRRLRREDLFDRPWHIESGGQMVDDRDGRPFSTEFAHSRFLVPHIAASMGLTGRVVFVDCDFMFMKPITEMVSGVDKRAAISVVKHDCERLVEGVKMDGMAQERYFRKLWSSLVVWNLDHSLTKAVTREFVNHASGSALHSFSWLEDAQIGALDPSWNYIPGLSSGAEINAVHWSLGGPWMEDYRNAMYSQVWEDRYEAVLKNLASTGTLQETFPLV